MTPKNTYLIVNAIPNTEDMPSFQSYISQIVPIFAKFGATNSQRFKTIEQVMGQGGIKTIAVFEFPNVQTIKDMLKCEEFTNLNTLRNQAYQQEVDLMICENL